MSKTSSTTINLKKQATRDVVTLRFFKRRVAAGKPKVVQGQIIKIALLGQTKEVMQIYNLKLPIVSRALKNTTPKQERKAFLY